MDKEPVLADLDALQATDEGLAARRAQLAQLPDALAENACLALARSSP